VKLKLGRPCLAFFTSLILALPAFVFCKTPSKKRIDTNLSRVQNITTLRIIQSQDTVSLLRENGKWVTGGEHYPVDPELVNHALLNFLEMDSSSPLNEPPDSAKFEKMGLDSQNGKFVEWTETNGESSRIILGNIMVPESLPEDSGLVSHGEDSRACGKSHSAPVYAESTYWSRIGSKLIYRTPGNPGGIPTKEFLWKDRTIFPFFLYEQTQTITVDWIDATGNKIHYKLKRISPTEVRLVEPQNKTIPRRNAAKIFVQTPQFTVDDFSEEGDSKLPASNLFNPDIRIQITTDKYNNLTIEAGKQVGEFQYVINPHNQKRIKVYKWRFDFFKKTVPELLDPFSIPPDTK
jgi:hypothetical protein